MLKSLAEFYHTGLKLLVAKSYTDTNPHLFGILLRKIARELQEVSSQEGTLGLTFWH
jgi:hypothetical protein